MSKKQKETKDSSLDLLHVVSPLIVRITALEQALAVHENRLNNLNIPAETVQTIIMRGLRMQGQMLLAVTEPQPEAPTQEGTEAPKEAAL